ncbi:MAG: biliverdin-producing heme oxygenase [Myxococcales bacterium]
MLEQLRETTRGQHEALDQSVVPPGEALTRERYAALLLGSFAVLRVLEERLERWFHAFSAPSRKQCLELDLSDLDVAVAVPTVLVPEVGSLAAAFGCAYVVEGSALGGLVMARSLRSAFGPELRALRYLTLRAEDTGKHFRSFCRELDAWGTGATPAERDQACTAASATFDAYAAGIEAARTQLRG